MLCPKCNLENKNTNIRCEYCGYTLQEVPETNNYDNDNHDDKSDVNTEIVIEKIANYYYIFIGLIMIIFGAGTGIMKAVDFYNRTGGFNFFVVIVGVVAIVLAIYGFSFIYKGVKTNKLVDRVKMGETVYQNEVDQVDKSFMKIYNGGTKLYILMFSIMWFGFLIFISYTIFKNGVYGFELFLIPFWIFGFVLIFMLFKKEKK